MDKWTKYLSILGLSAGEVKVYMIVLQFGPETVQFIADKSGLSRVSVYNTIQHLTKIGLMTSVEKGKKTLYSAEPPERILSLVENKINSLQGVVREIKDNLDELKLVQSGDKPTVKMYEGLDAFSAIQDDVLKSGDIDKMCEFGNLDEIDRVYPYDDSVRTKFFKELAKKTNTKRQLIFLTKNKTPKTVEKNKDIIYLDEEKYKFYGDIFFYSDTVWISNFKNKQVTVMIKNQGIKDTIQAAFDIIWSTLEKIS